MCPARVLLSICTLPLKSCMYTLSSADFAADEALVARAFTGPHRFVKEDRKPVFARSKYLLRWSGNAGERATCCLLGKLMPPAAALATNRAVTPSTDDMAGQVIPFPLIVAARPRQPDPNSR